MSLRLITYLLVFYFLMLPLQGYSQAVDIYSFTGASMISPLVKNALYRAYVPNSKSGTVSVIDPITYQVIDTFSSGKTPQHIVPSYDLQTLWVLNNRENTATAIDPTTAKPISKVAVDDPYNLYFTPDGKDAIVVCEARKQLQFRDPKTLQLKQVLPIECRGANHMEFSADNQFAIITCEFGAQLMKVDLINRKVIGYLNLIKQDLTVPKLQIAQNKITMVMPGMEEVQKSGNLSSDFTITADGKFFQNNANILLQATNAKSKNHLLASMPQDIRSTANGQIFMVADMMQDGVILIDPVAFKKIGFIATGVGTHAIYPSRDGKLFYVSNRGCHYLNCPAHGPGSVSVIDPEQRKVIANWVIPNGGSPDMGNVSPNGKELWLAGRYDDEVYVFDTTTGSLKHRIPVGKSPHGMTIWPQPGRYSLGHTGNMR